ncbi:Imelysin [Aquimixticola soesokkakensis]|uniref:Imelysin n=1 Tax=Aquimixticola soesokkakensis TaxID=1519096 RepID=A0A1Y5TLR6_9RHOB|nr:imelysin family protein [Aquimixticola soesokkakensis]SLN66827.1 Imelysin [Aquimixticola soesokkakensis]
MKRTLTSLSVLALSAAPAFAVEKTDVVATYIDIAQATYGDALTTAQTLDAAVADLIANPSQDTLEAARSAWLAARVPYQQSEVFRFGNPVVDDWEGKVNAWPLDEGLIDYVDASYGGATDENSFAALNVIATPTFTLSGTEVDATDITPDLIANTLQEADGVEANVASGYHAIEFLLWGQDLNGTDAGAGDRPYTDYATGADCTNGNCDRRGDYLQAATDLLVFDLEYMVAQWEDDGEAAVTLSDDPDAAITAMLTGMGSLSYGEQAGERMRLGLMLNDPEEEHDCFSDNTYNSHYYDGKGVQNVYLGSYTRVDGTEVSGPSLEDLLAETDAQTAEDLATAIDDTMVALGEMKTAAENGMAYDQMLAAGNAEGEAYITAGIEGLIAQTRVIERAVASLGAQDVMIEGSDSLDNPDAVFE